MKQNLSANADNDLLSGKAVLFWMILALLLGLGTWLMISPVAGTGDILVHVRAAHSFFIVMADSLNFPDWDATAYDGRGNPMLRFVGNLPLFVAAIFQLFGIDAVFAVKLVVVLFALIGLLGTLKLLEAMEMTKLFPWAALFLIVQPMVGFHLGISFFFQNLCAYWLAPWLLFSAYKIWQNKEFYKSFVYGCLAFGLIAWTHSIFSMMIGYAWGFIMVMGFLLKRERRLLIAAFGIPVLAIAISSPYSLPVMLTSGDIHYEESSAYWKPGNFDCEFLDDPFFFEKGKFISFTSALSLLTEKSDYPGLSILQMRNLEVRQRMMRPWLALTLLLCFIMACIGLYRWGSLGFEKIWGWALFLAGSMCAFMTLRSSNFAYSILPGATSVQFPFRWMGPALILWLPLLVLAVSSGKKIASNKFHRQKILYWAARVLMIAMIFFGLWLQTLFWTLPQSSIDRFFVSPGCLLPFYPKIISGYDKLPVNAGTPHRVKLIAGSGKFTDYQSGMEWMSATGTAEDSIVLNVNTHYDEYWQFKLNGADVLPEIKSENGTMLIKIPAGNWQLYMTRKNPAGRNPGWLIFALTLFGLAKLWKKENLV